MTNFLIQTILSDSHSVRNRSIDSLLQGLSNERLLEVAMELESFRRNSENLYHKVRASLFLFFIFRFRLLASTEISHRGKAPIDGIKAAGKKDFETAITIFLKEIDKPNGHNVNLFSAIAESYHKLSFQYLFGQVKLSISRCSENYHLFNLQSLDDYPYIVPPYLTLPDTISGNYPVGVDASPIRIDPSHSGWSDIFFLGMDFPEGARVINISVNLKVHGSDVPILPPCECYCRYIKKPVIRLSSVDLKTSKDISSLKELFNFSNDYLSLLKAGVVASGIVPPCFENSGISLSNILSKLLGKDGGIEIVTSVNNIPKGSRLAVSTTLLAAIITRLMRFSGQINNLTGPLSEEDRRIVASRAILGEWLGGSGGGWQDSGGLWPGIKVITGRIAEAGSSEFGVSRGCLLPDYTLFTKNEISPEVESVIIRSMVLVHGGISQDVGSILEMVTEKYLLKHDEERAAREKGIMLFDKITDALKSGNMKELGRLTSLDWEEAIQPIIPGVNNAFTDDLIRKIKDEFKDDYWGFLMLGGMSGGGMAFIVNPEINVQFKKRISVIMRELKDTYSSSYPFVIDPIVYDFNFNHEGISARLLQGIDAKIPEISKGSSDEENTDLSSDQEAIELEIINRYGFDKASHEHIRSLLVRGDISLEKNRLPISTIVEDVSSDELFHEEEALKNKQFYDIGAKSLSNGEVAVVTFAAGMGSRWCHGAAVAKPINPFLKVREKYRTFLEAHLAKSKKTAELSGRSLPHVFTTSYLTHDSINKYLKRFDYFGCGKDIYLSPGKSLARRVYPMARDLQFIWEKKLRQSHDAESLKAECAHHEALIEWTRSKGEGNDYSDNKPILRFNPPGHFYEIPNMLKNGTLAEILMKRPALKYILASNIDTLGANVSPELLGLHISNNACITFEVIPRYVEDKGGGLAKVNGRIQLIEGLALPREDDEFSLSYYSTLTNWISIDSMLKFFGLDREILLQSGDDKAKYDQIIEAIHAVEKRTPAYVTIKNVKYLWGNGQEDVYPVAQFERLWGDITGMQELSAAYVEVSRYRGQQLKEPSELDRWMNDGSFEHLMNIASF